MLYVVIDEQLLEAIVRNRQSYSQRGQGRDRLVMLEDSPYLTVMSMFGPLDVVVQEDMGNRVLVLPVGAHWRGEE